VLEGSQLDLMCPNQGTPRKSNTDPDPDDVKSNAHENTPISHSFLPSYCDIIFVRIQLRSARLSYFLGNPLLVKPDPAVQSVSITLSAINCADLLGQG
jgi:hypothetical protein